MDMLYLITLIVLNIFILGKAFKDDDVNSDAYRTVPEMIQSRGFEVESHEVTTDDGYILTIFRIINPFIRKSKRNNLKPVLMLHGILTSSKFYISTSEGMINSEGVYSEINGTLITECNPDADGSTETNTIGFILASCGYDVWLGNSRGNTYSSKHKTLSSRNSKYWEFSFQQMGLYDLPAFIHYILRHTQKSSLAFIAHSMGTTQMTILLSLKPKFASFLNRIILLAPVTYLSHSNRQFIIDFVAHFVEPILSLFRGPILWAVGDPTRTALIETLFSGPFDFSINTLLRLFFSEFEHLNRTRLKTYATILDRASTWSFAHYLQIAKSRKFQFFDFGYAKNCRIYCSESPPEIPIENIISWNISLMYSDFDIFANPMDVETFKSKLKVSIMDDYLIPIKWGHFDHCVSTIANHYINSRIMSLLNNY